MPVISQKYWLLKLVEDPCDAGCIFKRTVGPACKNCKSVSSANVYSCFGSINNAFYLYMVTAWACSSTLIMHMCTRLGGVAIVCDYPHPAIFRPKWVKLTKKVKKLLNQEIAQGSRSGRKSKRLINLDKKL